MKDTTIAVGLAKNVFEIAISREAGKVSKQLRVSRPKLVSFFAKQSAATVLLEACVSAHFWARTLRRLGHDVVLLPPHLVRRRCCTARSKLLTSLCRWQSHPAQYVSGIPSAVILLSISHPIRCSTRCLANVRVRISGPMIAL